MRSSRLFGDNWATEINRRDFVRKDMTHSRIQFTFHGQNNIGSKNKNLKKIKKSKKYFFQNLKNNF